MGILAFQRRWLMRHFRRTDAALLLICLFAFGCILLARWVGGADALSIQATPMKRWPVLLLPFLLWLAWVIILMIKRRYERPLRVIWRTLRRDPLWILRSLLLLATISAIVPAYSTFKIQIAEMVPFYADDMIIDLEAALFGQDAWRLTHAVFGLRGTVVLDRIYVLWFPVSAFMMTWAIMTRDRDFQVRAIATMFFVWFVLGNFVALALSSCGPVYYEHFYGDDRFTPLMDTLRDYQQQTELKAVAVSDWLLSDEARGKLGTGISAMPSVHVGMTFVTWLMVRSRIGWKNPVTLLLTLYVAAIWIGSVHLAWHYFLDGAVSIAGAALVWWASRMVVNPKPPLQPARPHQNKPANAVMPSGFKALDRGTAR